MVVTTKRLARRLRAIADQDVENPDLLFPQFRPTVYLFPG